MSTKDYCDTILDVVAKHNNVSPDAIINGGNKRELAYPRQQYFWICSKIKHKFPPGQMAWKHIGGYVKRHYSTCIMQSESLERSMSVMKKIKSDMDKIIEVLVLMDDVFIVLAHRDHPIISKLKDCEQKKRKNGFSYLPVSKIKFETN